MCFCYIHFAVSETDIFPLYSVPKQSPFDPSELERIRNGGIVS